MAKKAIFKVVAAAFKVVAAAILNVKNFLVT